MLQPKQILLERYQLQQKLGRTAAGRQTWLALDLELNEQVIVKLLAFSPQMQWEELKLFEREAKTLQNLSHPRIPRYRDYFSLDKETGLGLPWFGLVQDYIPGTSLQELLEQGQHFTEKQVKNIATQVLKILIYLHELNPPVLHRDIKPSNLILQTNKHIYLVDFGAVQDKAAMTGVTFTVVGTSGYAPLEQFWGRAIPASDLYALGATLIHLLTGVCPADLPQKDSKIQFADQVNVSEFLVNWIAKLTEIPLEKRYNTARQAYEELVKSESRFVSSSSGVPTSREISQPLHSRLKLKRSAEELEIDIPSQFTTSKLSSILYRFIWFVFVAIPILIFLNVFIPIKNFIFPFLILVLFEIYPIYISVKNWCEKTNIYFDRNVFQIEQKFFNYTYNQITRNVGDIVGVFLSSEGNSDTVSKISIRFFDTTYCQITNLSEDEYIWLAKEIQDWLYYR